MADSWKVLFCISCVVPWALLVAQEKSVRPGINAQFANPDAKEFINKFETESREVFLHRKEIVEACGIQPGMSVADIGAGTGLFSRLFSERVGPRGKVIAIDIAPNFLKHIEATSKSTGQENVATVLSTLDNVNLPAESIDVAFICDTYHHFEYPLKIMASVHRALKPEGRVVLVDFRRIPGKSKEWTLKHVRASQAVVESELVQAGFLKTGESTNVLQENYLVEFRKSDTPGLRLLEFPLVKGHGGVVPVEAAIDEPRAGAKVVFDVTSDSPVDKVNKGLERAARLMNLYGAAKRTPADVKITVVLHGEATKSVLDDEFYSQRFGTRSNPNLPLIVQLQSAGVEVIVCGQALNYKGFSRQAVSKGIPVAAAALTVVIHRQMDGYATIPVP